MPAKNSSSMSEKRKNEEDSSSSLSKKSKSKSMQSNLISAKENIVSKPDEKYDEVIVSKVVEKKEVERTKQTSIMAMFKKANSKSSKDGDESEKNNAASDEEEDVSKLKYNPEDFKLTSNEKEYNFKISSWNVNGIRAWMDHDGLDYIKAENPDIFVCQETKCDKSKIPPRCELPKYHCYWLSGDTQGYSGVGLMSKIKPINVTYGIGEKEFDDEGRVIIAEFEKFILINTYIPNASRGLVRLPFRLKWEEVFRKKLSELEKQKPIIWCGDLNVAHNEIDLKNPKTNTKSAGFTKEERECFTNVLTDGYFDSFRHLYPTKENAYTYWSYLRNSRKQNVGWRLDYFVMSEKLKPMLVDNVIRTDVTGSDHCPVTLFMNI